MVENPFQLIKFQPLKRVMQDEEKLLKDRRLTRAKVSFNQSFVLIDFELYRI